jgi:hypothetical protein
MPGRQTFLAAQWSERWKKSYTRLGPERQAACDRAVLALIKNRELPGLRVKPIRPEKYYLEARLNQGDRIVFRIEGGTIYFMDVISNDDIDRYGKRKKRR